MNRSMINAANTMNGLQQQLDLISHNVSNSSTIGYKRQEANFNSLLYQQFATPVDDTRGNEGRKTPSGIREGVGATLSHTSTDNELGSLTTTKRDLDVALYKKGYFFTIATKDGIKYTRDGAFNLSQVDENSVMLVTGDGNPVLDENGETIIIPSNYQKISFTSQGELAVYGEDETVPLNVYDLGIAYAQKPALLMRDGDNFFSAPTEQGIENPMLNISGQERSQIGLEQGVLEQSNVNIGDELANMLNAQRAYQFNAKSITLSDQMLGLINTMR
jgi:flagellar basal-body rod protein FlgG